MLPKCARRAEKIRTLAAERGYRANAAAKAMASGRFNAIGCLHSVDVHSGTAQHATLIAALHSELERFDFYVTSSYLSDERLTDPMGLPKFVRELAVDGLLIDYVGTPAHDVVRDLIVRLRVPAIWMNDKYPANCVYPDDVAAGQIATQHLIELGHRKIAYADLSTTSHYSHKDRLEGYRKAMKRAGLETSIVKPKHCTIDERFDLASLVLGQIDTPTAVVTPSSGTSTPLISSALARGLKPGKDIAFTTTGPEQDRSFGFPISTVLIPFQEVGRVATRELVGQVEDTSRQTAAIAVPPVLERGVTT
ncbi:MAG: LacI family DNA-binding transcriptional regulator [Planctomycetota bacterium]